MKISPACLYYLLGHPNSVPERNGERGNPPQQVANHIKKKEKVNQKKSINFYFLDKKSPPAR
jgi:hypothetical protein